MQRGMTRLVRTQSCKRATSSLAPYKSSRVCLCRVAELEGELCNIRELVVLLGKAMGRLPGGQQLPSHDDPVWLQLGPLGGVSFALDTVIKHTRVSTAVSLSIHAAEDDYKGRRQYAMDSQCVWSA